jgi:hypothetical protein
VRQKVTWGPVNDGVRFSYRQECEAHLLGLEVLIHERTKLAAFLENAGFGRHDGQRLCKFLELLCRHTRVLFLDDGV